MPKKIFLVVVAVVVAVVALTEATKVAKCKKVNNLAPIITVNISGCITPPCRLKKGTEVSIDQRFIADREIASVQTSVSASLFGLSLPFPGVDGTDACRDIYAADGSTVGCPLKKDKEYIYKNKFPILRIYPTLPLNVHWALQDNGKRVTCFEIRATIV